MNRQKKPAPQLVSLWRCPICNVAYESGVECKEHMAMVHKRTMTTHRMEVVVTLLGSEEPDMGLRRCPRVMRDSWIVDADLAQPEVRVFSVDYGSRIGVKVVYDSDGEQDPEKEAEAARLALEKLEKARDSLAEGCAKLRRKLKLPKEKK